MPTPGVWEIIYANLLTLIGIYLIVRLDEALDQVVFRPSTQWTIWIMFFIAALVYVSFSINPPIHFFTTLPI